MDSNTCTVVFLCLGNVLQRYDPDKCYQAGAGTGRQQVRGGHIPADVHIPRWKRRYNKGILCFASVLLSAVIFKPLVFFLSLLVSLCLWPSDSPSHLVFLPLSLSPLFLFLSRSPGSVILSSLSSNPLSHLPLFLYLSVCLHIDVSMLFLFPAAVSLRAFQFDVSFYIRQNHFNSSIFKQQLCILVIFASSSSQAWKEQYENYLSYFVLGNNGYSKPQKPLFFSERAPQFV